MPPNMQRVNDQIEKLIEKHGWTAMAVMPGEGEPGFTYSIGFEQTVSHPEIVFVGFDHQLSPQLISSVANSLRNKELYLPPEGGLATGVIQNFDVLVRPVPEPYKFNLARAAIARMEGGDLRLLQICLPDSDGRLPGDPLCKESFEEMQDYRVFKA